MILTTADDRLEDNSSRNKESVKKSVGLKLLHKDSAQLRPISQQPSKVSSSSSSTTPLQKKTSSKHTRGTTTKAAAKKKSVTKSSKPAKGGRLYKAKGTAAVKKTRAKKKTSSKAGVQSPADADVLCGRVYQSNQHKGNMHFRDCVMKLRSVYVQAAKVDKTELAKVSSTHLT